VEQINLLDYTIKGCTSCFSCTRTRKCRLMDDFEFIYSKSKEADLIVYAFPVFMNSVPGHLKTFFDRHAHATIPFYDENEKRNLIEQAKAAIKYGKGFKENRPFVGKNVISFITCSNPMKTGVDVKNSKIVLHKFYEEMGLKNVGELAYTDTLFKLWDKEKKIMEEAYLLGKNS